MKRTNLSIETLLPTEGRYAWLKVFSPVIDRILGVDRLDDFYNKHGFQGLGCTEFTQKFIHALNFKLEVQLAQVPASGPAILVANHPYGGLEGVLLAHFLSRRHQKVKILANRGLRIFPELEPYFIYTNPLKTAAKGNASSIKACIRHLSSGGMLMVFPAGRVSYSASANERVKDHPWNRMISALARRQDCAVVPLFVSGQNRALFYRMGHLYYRLRMLMLIRELLNSHGRKITMSAGKPMPGVIDGKSDRQMTDIYRLMTYLQDEDYRRSWNDTKELAFKPIAAPVSGEQMALELAALPTEQRLLSYKSMSVFYASRAQVPRVTDEIRRLREMNFRTLGEGSGEPQDGDEFDDTYTQLFVFDNLSQSVLGAYRMGRTDELLKRGDVTQLYLSRMFHFEADFCNRLAPCLEMGRSFVVAEHQRSFHGLLLLFKGIGQFVASHPQYRTLYGTVSLSKQYDPLSVLLIQEFLVVPDGNVSPIASFEHPHSPELSDYIAKHHRDIETLEYLVKQIEPDGKGLPVLLKQYHHLGAKFHCVGIDPNFADTPGLLLSVHLPSAPEKLLRLYLGSQAEPYLQHVAGQERSSDEA